MNSDDDQETLGEILWELADSRAKQADLAAGRADVIAARNMAELKHSHRRWKSVHRSVRPTVLTPNRLSG